MKDKRRNQRRKVRLEGTFAFINTKGEEIAGSATVKDISIHGVYLVSDACPDMGSKIELLLNWPQREWDARRLLTLDAKVVRLDSLASKVWGVAVDLEGCQLDETLEREKGVLTLEELEAVSQVRVRATDLAPPP